jgi:tRNA A37 threonylcarbamoyladenosine modification protein TsaB
VALLPAGRGEVFSQLLSVAADGKVIELDHAAHLSPQRMLEQYGSLRRVIWAGPGAHAFKDLLTTQVAGRGLSLEDAPAPDQSRWCIAPVEQNLAKHVAALALPLYLAGQSVAPELLSAIYVRPSDAELKVNVVN